MIDYSNKCLITEIMYFKILRKNCNFFFLFLIKRKLRKGGGGSKRTKKNPSAIFNVSPSPPFFHFATSENLGSQAFLH